MISFYESYFDNRQHLTTTEQLPYNSDRTSTEAKRITEESMHPTDLENLKNWCNAELQENVGLLPFQEFMTTETGLAFVQRFLQESGHSWPQDPEVTGEMDLERRTARWQVKRGRTDISVVIPNDHEYCEITDEEAEEEILEEQHNDILEEVIAEEVARGKKWVRKDRAPSPSPAVTDVASQVTFRPRATSARQRSVTPEPGQIRSKNKMAREVLEDAHASGRRDRRREFYQRPPYVACIVCQDAAPFFCRGCGNSWCAEDYIEHEEYCTCPASVLSCEVHEGDIPISIEEDADLGDIQKLEHLAQDMDSRFGGWQPADRQRVRTAYFQDLKKRVKEGESTGSTALDKALTMSERALKQAKSSFYTARTVPTLQEHMQQQLETHPYPLKRPSLLFDLGKQWEENEIVSYTELAKSMLSMGCKNIPDYVNEERVVASTNNLSFLLLNLGNLDRPAQLPGNQSIPRHLTIDNTCNILCTLPYRNPGNVTILCEAWNFQHSEGIAEEHQCITMIAGHFSATYETGSPPIACILPADETSTIELLRDFDIEVKNKMWLIHAATFRMIWGRKNPDKARVINPATGETVLLSEFLPADYPGNDETGAEVCATVAASCTINERLKLVETSEIAELECTIPPYKPGDELDVKRLNMPELRICALHINSTAFRNAFTAGKEALYQILWYAIADQVDVICGDSNLFGQRLCSTDQHSDHNSSCVVNLLELILKSFNKRRKAIHRITYDIRSSTIETEWVKAQLAYNADTDCMLYIHLNYGKESITMASRAKEVDNRGMTGYEGPVRQCEAILKVSEHLKYIEPIDLMLKHTDHDFH